MRLKEPNSSILARRAQLSCSFGFQSCLSPSPTLIPTGRLSRIEVGPQSHLFSSICLYITRVIVVPLTRTLVSPNLPNLWLLKMVHGPAYHNHASALVAPLYLVYSCLEIYPTQISDWMIRSLLLKERFSQPK